MNYISDYDVTSNNPVLTAHAIWSVFQTVKERLEKGEKESKIMDLRTLFMLCEHKNGLVSKTACQAVVGLVQCGILSITYAMTTLISSLVTTLVRPGGAIGTAICNLMSLEVQMIKPGHTYDCPFNLEAPQHPLITVLVLKQIAWRDVLNHIRTMMHNCRPEWLENHLTLLRPVFLYILCNPTPSVLEICKQNAWNLLMRTDGTAKLQVEVLQWIRTKFSDTSCDANSRVIELAEVADAYEYGELCSALIPLIMSLAVELLKNGSDPRPNLDIVASILVYRDPNAGTLLISLLAEMVSITPSMYLLDIVKMAAAILESFNCNRIMAFALVASLVQWMGYPTILSADALDVGKQLIETIINGSQTTTETEKLFKKSPLDQLWHSDSRIQFFSELCTAAESFTNEHLIPWFEKISNSPAYLMERCKLLVSAVFIETEDNTILEKSCEILLKLGKTDSHVMSIIFYKLSITRDVEQSRLLLLAMPKLLSNTENAPIILQTLKYFCRAEEPLNYFALELFVNAVATDKRGYATAVQSLVDFSNYNTCWQGDIALARAMQRICENYPEHGADLVPLLSKTLNRSSTSRNGGAACALIIKAIASLCDAGIIEICSTWKVLAPKLTQETRPIVVRALCEFFSIVPSCLSKKPEAFNKLMDYALTTLWDYAFNSDIGVVEAAFKGLSAYKLDTMSVNVLPQEMRGRIETVKTDEQNIEENSGASVAVEEVSNFIPPTCWISLLKNIRPTALPHAGTFLQKMIEDELYSLRSGIFRWPQGEPVNFKYLSERSPTRALGEHIRRYECSEDNEEKRILTECLRIFAHKYPKSLPPIHWRYLEKAIAISPETQKYGILMACHQAKISPTAKEYLEKKMTLFSRLWNGTSEQLKTCLEYYGELDDICEAVGSNVLGPFLEMTIDFLLEMSSLNKEESVEMFSQVMSSFTKALRDDLIHHDNRSLLTDTLEKLMDRIDVKSKIFDSYINAVVELPTEQVERLTLPSVWLNFTDEKLKKAIRIRCLLVLKKNVKVPLTWMNEVIRATLSAPDVIHYLLGEMRKLLQQMRLEPTNANWTFELMRWIDSLVADERKSGNIAGASLLCDILFVTVIGLSAIDSLLVDEGIGLQVSNLLRGHLFSQALVILAETPEWKDLMPQIMEWINHMKTTPLSIMYKIVFHNSLLLLKNEDYFEVMWTKYLSTRAPFYGH